MTSRVRRCLSPIIRPLVSESCAMCINVMSKLLLSVTCSIANFYKYKLNSELLMTYSSKNLVPNIYHVSFLPGEP